MLSFDLQVALASHFRYKCPNHGTAQCDCQMVILLIYGHGHQPASMVVHGQDGKTYLSLVNSPHQRPDRSMLIRIRIILAANAYAVQ